MLFIIRVDADVQMGMGHAARCLQLALRLRDRGATIHFASDNKAVEKLVSPHEFSLLKTQEDIAALDQSIDWIILDHPLLDIGYERIMKEHANKLMVLDDTARHHDCDLLFDQNAGDQNRYNGKLADGTHTCIGSDYILIDEAYHNRSQNPHENNSITLGFGGSDPHGLTIRSMAALSECGAELHFIVGAQNPTIDKIQLLAADRDNWHIHYDLSAKEIASLYVSSRFAIGCGGGMLWERLAVGIPSMEISLDASHDALLAPLHDAHHIHHIGSVETAFDRLLESTELWLQETPTFKSLKVGSKVNELIDVLMQ